MWLLEGVTKCPRAALQGRLILPLRMKNVEKKGVEKFALDSKYTLLKSEEV